MFSKGDEKVEGGLRQIPLSEDVGLTGSSASDPVISRTIKDRYVEAHVDPKGLNGKAVVMCVSRDIDLKQLDTHKNKYMK